MHTLGRWALIGALAKANMNVPGGLDSDGLCTLFDKCPPVDCLHGGLLKGCKGNTRVTYDSFCNSSCSLLSLIHGLCFYVANNDQTLHPLASQWRA